MSLIQSLKSKIDLTKLVQAYGYEFDKKKSSKNYGYYSSNNDNILIYYNKTNNLSSYYYTTCNNPSDSGDIINFLINKRYASNNTQALELLKQFDITSFDLSRFKQISPKKILKKQFSPIKVNPINKQTYLCHPDCGIAPGQLNNQYFQNRIFNGSTLHKGYYNTIFPIYRLEKIIGQELRNHDYKHLVEGSSKSEGLWQSNPIPGAEIFQMLESPKDAISYSQITRTKEKIIFFSTFGSPSKKQIKYFFDLHRKYQIKHNRSVQIRLCGDNDIAGQLFNINFILIYITQYLTSTNYTISITEQRLNLELFYNETTLNKLASIQNPSGISIEHQANGSFNFSLKKEITEIKELGKLFLTLFDLLDKFSVIFPITENGDFTDDLKRFKNKIPLSYVKPYNH